MMTDFQKRNFITVYNITFSYQQGENIKLSLYAKSNHMHNVASELDLNIKSYVNKFPSPQPIVRQLITGFFMHMPNNLVKYNMYVYSEGFRNNNTLRYRITEALISAICKEPINYTNVFSFLFYMQASTLKAIKPDKADAIKAIKQIVENINNSSTNEVKAIIETRSEKLLAENKQYLNDILAEVWDNNIPKTDLKWMFKWTRAVKSHFDDQLSFEVGYDNVCTDIIQQTSYPDKYIHHIGTVLLYQSLKYVIS